MNDEITSVSTNRFDASAVHHLSGMYQNWFLDYASYVILERAVPHIEDGLKPVQRRILHSMKRMDDGRYNKVANIVGHTMQFHPHGDASIGDALVQLGQKDLLVDTQGNWGNVLTGDRAAAPRYIEARLSKFALDTVFNPKTTEWQLSYDGRNKEPVTLPVKFPLLLAQGAEGIAVGLSSKILPHNFVEICDAAISYLRQEEFHLYPDFPTGGSIDVSKYNDGQRGGVLKVREKIEKLDNKTLVIKEIPYSDGPRAKVKCYGADDVREGVAILWKENVDVSITGNSTNPTRFQHPVAGTYKKERVLAGKPYFSVASGGGTGRTLHPDNMAAGPASYGMTDTLGRLHSDAQFAGSSSVPAHVEMMGFLGIGNNPMVGATVSIAVEVDLALNKK